MPTIDDVRFDTVGWQLVSRASGEVLWRNDRPEQLSLNFFDLRPDLGASLDDVGRLRDWYRELVVSAGLALVSVDVLSVGGVRAVKTIFKVPQRPSGMTYLGSLTLPFRDFSFVIKVQSNEQGPTGMRDAVVFAKHAASAAGRDPREGWMRDPYDPARRDRLMRNGAEDERYDAQFPDHPLSRVRQHLGRAAASLQLDPRVAASPPFAPAR